MLSESFDRMLAHEAVPTTQAHATCDERDPLVAAIMVPRLEGVPTKERAPPVIADSPDDPVVQSFACLPNHEPGRFTPERPEGLGTDPMIAAIVLPLMRANQSTVVDVASVTHR